ncbi:MAG: lipopolysaccharide heptosyltransferase II [Kiritimatiellaeota bacterium]|nr:lipopolysaccharide heptosyltransferase II [Kiritimatiellota bacterium]
MLVVSPGWIGDALMALPALQLFRAQHPGTEITVLAKPGLLPLWELHTAPQRRLAVTGIWQTTLGLMRGGFSAAYLLPNSVRAALLPWLAVVPERIGLAGHWRSALLTQVVTPPLAEAHRHQAWEYAAILAPHTQALPTPQLTIPSATIGSAAKKIASLPRPLIGIMPGAARGPVKRWPAERFAGAAKTVHAKLGGSVVIMGGAGDAEACAAVAAGVGAGVLNLAGATALGEWAALLAECGLVLCNDSGGMHLAAAVGVPVVAVFGITDPTRTGPLGVRCRVVQRSAVRDRAVPRESAAAVAALAAVSVQEVVAAALALMESGANHA